MKHDSRADFIGRQILKFRKHEISDKLFPIFKVVKISSKFPSLPYSDLIYLNEKLFLTFCKHLTVNCTTFSQQILDFDDRTVHVSMRVTRKIQCFDVYER